MSVNTSQPMSQVNPLYRLLAVVLLALSAPVMAQDSEEASESDPPNGKPTGKLMIEEEDMSPGMRLAFDGSSTAAFEKSMEAIKADTTEAEFTTVRNAIDYLLVYDLASRHNPEELYKRLDGKTPVEMLKMVNWQTGKRPTRSR